MKYDEKCKCAKMHIDNKIIWNGVNSMTIITTALLVSIGILGRDSGKQKIEQMR